MQYNKNFFVLFFYLFCNLAIADDGILKALIYDGAGTCRDGCPQAAAEIPASMGGFKIEYVTNRKLTENIFTNDVALWIQGGGNSLKASKAMGLDRIELVKNYVKNGGAYVGFCAGAFLADEWLDTEKTIPGFGLVPFSVEYYPLDVYPIGAVIGINWNGKGRNVFFNGGATFDIPPKYQGAVNVIATYPNGSPAAIETAYGKGTVVIAGFHPEATWAWLKQNNHNDPDGLDHDLAREMIQRALKKYVLNKN